MYALELAKLPWGYLAGLSSIHGGLSQTLLERIRMLRHIQ